MKKFKLFQIFCTIVVFIIKTTTAGYCEYDDEYSKCYERENCKFLLDSYIVYALEECGNLKGSACNDFFDYAIGHFFLRSYAKNQLKDMQEKYSKQITDFSRSYDEDLENFQTTIELYLSECKYKSKHFEHHIPPLLDGLDKIESLHWPNWTLALEQDEWEQDDFDLPNALGELRRLGLNNIFFKEHVTLAYNDANKLILELKVPDDVDKFVDNAELTFRLFDLVKERTYQHTKLMNKINELDELLRRLKKKHVSSVIETISEKKIWTLAKLKQEIPHFDWQKYFNALLKQTIDAEHFELQLNNPSYFKDLATLIDQTHDKEIAFYILLRFIYFHLHITPRDVDITCEESAANQFAFGANYAYKRKTQKDHEANEATLKQIFEALKTQFSKKLNENKYKLGEADLTQLQEKLRTMELRIGNTPLDLPTEFYDQFYKVANITEESSHVENVREMMKARFIKQHERLFHNPPTKAELDYYFAYDNGFEQPIEPFYVLQRNFVVVPQQFLTPPFYMSGTHKVFQYATTGFGIARALMEAFMSVGVLYDAEGQEHIPGSTLLQNVNFLADLKCIHKASKEFRQRFPDIPGLQLVIDTFYNEIPETDKHTLVLRLTDVMDKNYNMKDLFFRFFAHYFRGNRFYGFHYSTHERLNDIFPHIKQFAELYNCTNVNAEICSLW